MYEKLKNLVRAYYDVQMIRIAIENRSRTSNMEMGFLVGESSYLKKAEKELAKEIEKELENIPIYREYLSQIKGLGPVLSASLITTFDVYKAEHPSSFWKYAGLHVENGKAVKRQRGKKVDYNPNAKTLAWKVGRQLLMSNNPFYRNLYEKFREYERNKLNNPENDPKACPLYSECSKSLKKAERPSCKMHIHMRALRKMIKYFLAELHIHWRKIEGLPVSAPYGVAKNL